MLFFVLLVSHICHILRNCLGAFRTSAMQILYVEANEPPLCLRFEKLYIEYALKLRSNPDNPAYVVVLTLS